jgi:hypothetical protein
MKRNKPLASLKKEALALTPPQCTAVSRVLNRKLSQPAPPRFTLVKNGDIQTLALEQSSTTGFLLLMDALGTANEAFANGILRQLTSAARPATQLEDLNFMISVIAGIKPKDEVKAMCAAQQAVAHLLAMRFAERLTQTEQVEEMDVLQRGYNKLSRTFATLMQTSQTAGERKVVQNVSVADGGQAVVGNVTHLPTDQPRERGTLQRPEQPTPVTTDARTAALPNIEQPKVSVVRRRLGHGR